MRLFSYDLERKTFIWAQLEERDIAELLLAGGFHQVNTEAVQTPDFAAGDCVVELKCVEEDPLFPNGSLRYVYNRQEISHKLLQKSTGTEGKFTVHFSTEFLVRRAEKLLRKAKHQLRSSHAAGRVTGVIIVNNASFSIAVAREAFLAALRDKAREAKVIDFVVFMNVFSQSTSRPRIDLSALEISQKERVGSASKKIVQLLQKLPDYIIQTSKRQKAKPHKPPTVTLHFNG